MTSLTAYLSEIVGRAFAACGLPAELGRTQVSDRPDLGQFQCNGALAAAKIARKPPRAVAEAVVDVLRAEDAFAGIAIAGPGFVNLTLTDGFLGAQIAAMAGDARLGVPARPDPLTVILDFGGPNVAKPMHVGHLRATIIGDSLQRLYRFLGDRTISDVHLGDWGLPMGMLITEIRNRRPDLPYFDEAYAGPYPDEPPVTLEDLEELYPVAAAACRDDPARLEEARAATAALQAHRPGYWALWRHFIRVSLAALDRDFGTLGVRFDLFKGEADVNDLIPAMIAHLTAKDLARRDEGALVVPVAEADDKQEIPPLILEKSDGGVMYGTTDLATIVDRVQSFDPDLVLYVVDQRQHLHFEQVFRAARKAGLSGKARLEHIGFGTMNGLDGRPFKTRAGGVMKLQDLIGAATDQAEARLTEAGLASDYPAEERADVARMVGIAAVKFADLSNWRMSNYIFDLDRFMRFEGRTGPYLQYAAVRIKSLLRKAADQGAEPGAILPPSDIERDLMLELARLPDAVAAAEAKRAPSELADFAYGAAQAFSRFYASCHILSEADRGVQASQLALSALTLRTLVQVLDLLGIEVPERM